MQSDLLSLRPLSRLDRRSFIATSLTVGFAVAAGPVAAQTAITTDTSGLTAGEVTIPTEDGGMPAYRAMPSTGGPFPTVLVVQEIFGVHEHIKDVARRFAKQGYLAIAPDLYARQGDMSKVTDVQTAISVAMQVPDAQVMDDLDASVAWAAENSGDTGRLGITGFCWGGRIVWLYAAHNPELGAGVAWYGRLVGEASERHPRHPIDVAGEIQAPVLGLYGGADSGIPLETVERMRQALQAAGNTRSEIHVYPDAPHAFHADYRPSYRKEAAEDGWRRTLNWFERYDVA